MKHNNIGRILREEIEKVLNETDCTSLGGTSTFSTTDSNNALGDVTPPGAFVDPKDPTMKHRGGISWEKANESTDVMHKPIYKPKTSQITEKRGEKKVENHTDYIPPTRFGQVARRSRIDRRFNQANKGNWDSGLNPTSVEYLRQHKDELQQLPYNKFG